MYILGTLPFVVAFQGILTSNSLNKLKSTFLGWNSAAYFFSLPPSHWFSWLLQPVLLSVTRFETSSSLSVSGKLKRISYLFVWQTKTKLKLIQPFWLILICCIQKTWRLLILLFLCFFPSFFVVSIDLSHALAIFKQSYCVIKKLANSVQTCHLVAYYRLQAINNILKMYTV